MNKPKFGFTRYHSESRFDTLAFLVRTFPRQKFFRVLEIGSYEGASALALSKAVAQQHDAGCVVCIDPWVPFMSVRDSPHLVYMQNDLANGDAFWRFRENVGLADPRAPIGFLRGTLETFAPLFALDAFDFVYIDGDHRYEAVLHDLELAQSLVRTGGLLCGDDLEIQKPDCSDWKDGDEQKEFNGVYHPSVTAAIWKFFKHNRVWLHDGVWAVQCVRSGFNYALPRP